MSDPVNQQETPCSVERGVFLCAAIGEGVMLPRGCGWGSRKAVVMLPRGCGGAAAM